MATSIMSQGFGDGFNKAQRDYDNQMPPEDPEYPECEKCEGSGKIFDDGAPDAVAIKCDVCDGLGYIVPDEPDFEEDVEEPRERYDDNEQ